MHALDVTIVSQPVFTPSGDIVMSAYTQMYDKRWEPCFAGLPSLGFSHVSSNVADSVHTAVTTSALHRASVCCGDLDNFVRTVADLVLSLRSSGYRPYKVWKNVKRFVMSSAFKYGETNPFTLIYHSFLLL